MSISFTLNVVLAALTVAAGVVATSKFDEHWEKTVAKSKCKPINAEISETRKNEIAYCINSVLGCDVNVEDCKNMIKESSQKDQQIIGVVKCVATRKGILTEDGNINRDKADQALTEVVFDSPQVKEALINARRQCLIANREDFNKALLCSYKATILVCGLRDGKSDEAGSGTTANRNEDDIEDAAF